MDWNDFVEECRAENPPSKPHQQVLDSERIGVDRFWELRNSGKASDPFVESEHNGRDTTGRGVSMTRTTWDVGRKPQREGSSAPLWIITAIVLIVAALLIKP